MNNFIISVRDIYEFKLNNYEDKLKARINKVNQTGFVLNR